MNMTNNVKPTSSPENDKFFHRDNLNTGFQVSTLKYIVGLIVRKDTIISKISLRFRNSAYTNTAKNGEINI